MAFPSKMIKLAATIVAVKNTTKYSVCVAEIHVTVNYIKILNVEQQCFYGKFMSPAKITRMVVFM